METVRPLDLPADLRSCPGEPVAPDPDDPLVSQEDVGDWMVAYSRWAIGCSNRVSTQTALIDRHNQDAEASVVEQDPR